MATSFPTNIDTFTDQTSSDLITSAKWNNLQDSIKAIEAKVGADNSAITTSHDYKLIGLATTLGAITSAADVVDLEKLHGITSSATEINQLHESGVMNADFEKLQDTVDKLSQLHESGVTTDDLEKLHDITVEAAPIGKIKARAYTNAAHDIDAGPSATKVLIDTIDRDTEGVVDTTNSRIIPNLPGDYVVMGNVCAGSEPSDLRINALILKNGVLASCGTSGSGIQDEIPSQTQDRLVSSSVSDLIYMNGTDDYLELWVLNSSSSASALAYTVEPTVCPINYISVLGPF
jgi:hypothetical protein